MKLLAMYTRNCHGTIQETRGLAPQKEIGWLPGSYIPCKCILRVLQKTIIVGTIRETLQFKLIQVLTVSILFHELLREIIFYLTKHSLRPYLDAGNQHEGHYCHLLNDSSLLAFFKWRSQEESGLL